MEPHDISPEITSIGRSYRFAQEPTIVRDFKLWLVQVAQVAQDWIDMLFHRDGSSVDSHSVSWFLQVVVWIAAAVGLAVLAVSLVKRARNSRDSNAKRIQGAAEVDELLDSDGLKLQAEKFAQSGDYRSACRALYLSALRRLHEREVAAFAPAKTNYEYSYSLLRYPEIQKSFRQVADRVELIWFGNQPATSVEYEAAVQEVDSLARQIAVVQTKRQAEEGLPA